MNFNEEQRNAIEATNSSVIISAAAGSGKTTVLIEKIIKLIEVDHHKITNMLMITFTREAASHMRIKLKEKLERKLQENPTEEIIEALNEIDHAQISTIHSFCSTLLRENFHKVNIDPMYRISEGDETKPLFEQAYHEVLNETLTEEPGSEFKNTIDDLQNVFTQKTLFSIVETLYHKLMGIPEPFQTVNEMIGNIDKEGQENPWVLEVLQSVKLDLLVTEEYKTKGKILFSQQNALDKCRKIYEQDLDLLKCLDQIDQMNQDELLSALTSIYEQWPRCIKPRNCTEEETTWYEAYKSIRDKIIAGKKGIIPEMIHDLEKLENREEYDANEAIKKQNVALLALTEKTADRYIELKRQIHVLDFEDLEQLTYSFLTDTENQEYKKDIQKRYTDIFVDECQDISAIQDAIIMNLHDECNQLTMVGDVKQSIYRFRHADPSLFLYYRDHYGDDVNSEKRRIFFRSNYRSSAKIIDAVNQVFQNALIKEVNELDYLENDFLVYGKLRASQNPVEIHLIEQNKEINSFEAECVYIAERINELVNQTYIDDQGQEKQITYKDITILMRSAKEKGPKAVEVFKKLHIPVFYDGGENYYELPEIITMISILQAIDNVKQDIPLIATLRSIAFHYTDEELSTIRNAFPEHIPYYEAFEQYQEKNDALAKKCVQTAKTLENWKFLSQVMKLSDFIWYMIRFSSIYAYSGSFKDGDIRQANLRLLSQKAKTFEENTNGTFSEFVQTLSGMLSGNIQGSDSDAISFLSDNDDVVRVMTMHKSKGLEYPVIFLLGVETKLVKKISKNPLLIDIGSRESENPHLGMYLPKADAQNRTIMHTFGKNAFEIKQKKNELAEQARLLYVAMTRAMDYLIIVGEKNQNDHDLWDSSNAAYRIWNSKTMLDLIMPAYKKNPDDSLWILKEHEAESLPEEENEMDATAFQEMIQEKIEESMKESKPVSVPPAKPFEPIKTTVTSIARLEKNQVVMDSVTEENIETKRSIQDIVPMMLSSVPEKPKFIEERETTGAEIGTQTHRFLSLVDLQTQNESTTVIEWIKHERKRMIREGIFTAEDMKKINEAHVIAFFTSQLGIRMSMSAKVMREWSFNVCINEKDSTIMQGIIDAVFYENNQWVLVDYKTEYVSDEEEFIKRHAIQLNLYRYAIEKLTGIPVSEMWLYSTYQGKEYKVPLINVFS